MIYTKIILTTLTRSITSYRKLCAAGLRRPPSLFSLGPDRRTATPHGPATLEDGAPWPLRITRSTGAIGDRFVPRRQRLRRLHEHREAMQGRDLRGIERRLCAHRSLRRPPSHPSA